MDTRPGARSAAEPAGTARHAAAGSPKRATHGGCAGCLARPLAICASIPAADTHALEAAAGEVLLPAGATLASEGDPRREVYTVTRGMLRRVRLLSDGRRLVAGFLMAGDFIGFSGAPRYRHTLEAVTDCGLCAFPLQSMRSLCQRYPDLESGMLAQACSELDATRGNLMLLGRLAPGERLAGFLVELGARQQPRGGASDHVDLPMTRADIADHLGLTIETVSRSFTRLRQSGAIAFEDPRRIRLVDVAALRRAAGL
ncbi:Crp/Fnr family transcriptional regulator [Luteimonas sp. 9C]|uniref:Crp/Fnr family transcriptional regulator n=1 Tax=Luteimonas sp. 9C TaxID=2653148 RepID=UPI0012F0B9D7|nr:helix-turn-helix domain-containing protein [Luteimonas sp. 9C]VXB76409.1 Crp/Fnr family transcriptional regulator [Luteimonas sp. 9C]